MITDLIYLFKRWRRRCKLIRIIELTYPADSMSSHTGLDFVVAIGSDVNIDWRELPLAKLELYAKGCVFNSEALLQQYPKGNI